ncbi:MAG TPA: TonB-dependent receptor, partial [Saprospiraceae bacterium]|nr:TonB-dependent receptor [Saprospiraceae bacterium]
ENVEVLNSAKIRLSYGSIGNQAINPYQTQALLGRTSYAWDVNTAAFGYRPNTIGNPDLRWESSSTLNGGLDYELFEGRLYGSI